MKMLQTDRRLFIAFVGILTITALAFRSNGQTGSDTIWGIVAIVGAICGSNAYQAIKTHLPSSVQSVQNESIVDNSDPENGDAKPKRKK